MDQKKRNTYRRDVPGYCKAKRR